MLPKSTFDKEVRAFIEKNKEVDLSQLLLKRPGNKEWDWLWIAQQIEGYQKAKKKIKSLSSNDEIIYPRRISIQQCSSDATAAFKAKLFHGKSFLDLSGGFGIDTFHISGNFEKSIYVERDEELCDIMLHNIAALKLDGKIKVKNEKAEDYLTKSNEKYDLIYVDPARRDTTGKKVFRFSDCSPDVVLMLDLLKEKAKKVLIKAAPMLDISQGIRELQYVEKVYVLANSRECKELLFVLGEEPNSNPEIISVQLDTDHIFSFYQNDEYSQNANYRMEGKYLYNPGPAISKAGGFKSLAMRFKLNIIHPNTHLFLSDNITEGFPGKIYKILDFIPFGSKHDFGKSGYTIYLKNFPFEKNEIMKKYKLNEGSDLALFAFSSTEGKNLLAVCEILEN